jgi:ketosteroid isomerase-like protein
MRTLELATALIGCVFTMTTPVRSAAQIGRGGDQPAPNAVAAAYRTEVHNKLNHLVIQLAGAWDGSDPGEATRLYAPNAVIVLGPDRTITGRDAIRDAFASTLRHMRGVVLSIDDYDLSGELAFLRGTMIYELLHDGSPGSQEAVSYTMVLRRQRSDEWLVQLQTLGGSIVLPDTKKANASRATDVIRQ